METVSAERELGRLIERRHDPQDGAEMEDPSYAESVRRHNARVRGENRAAWARFHEGQAERHRRTLADLVAHHEREAARLLGAATPGEGRR